jgi:NDP-sugar pyrophosphorylase family protein
MGIYILNKKALELIPENKYYGFDHLVLDLLRTDEKINVVLHEGYWLDIGRPDDYMKAIDEFDSMKHIFINEMHF